MPFIHLLLSPVTLLCVCARIDMLWRAATTVTTCTESLWTSSYSIWLYCSHWTNAVSAHVKRSASHAVTAYTTAYTTAQHELHKYSHMVRPPAWIAKLQNAGIILNKRDHGLHHSSPFEEKYCIVTGHCNGIMDSSGLFRRMEKVIYERTGVEPNCWILDESGKVKAAAMKY
eukprot:8548-Heterococcus_DN1.PRE.1